MSVSSVVLDEGEVVGGWRDVGEAVRVAYEAEVKSEVDDIGVPVSLIVDLSEREVEGWWEVGKVVAYEAEVDVGGPVSLPVVLSEREVEAWREVGEEKVDDTCVDFGDDVRTQSDGGLGKLVQLRCCGQGSPMRL